MDVVVKSHERMGQKSPADSLHKIATTIRKCKMDPKKIKWVFSITMDRVREKHVELGQLSNQGLFGTKGTRGQEILLFQKPRPIQ